MTPSEHASQSIRMEEKLDKLLINVTRIDTYQKTHFRQLNDLENEQKKIETRVRVNEQRLMRAGGGFSIVLIILTAWVSDFFKGGGS